MKLNRDSQFTVTLLKDDPRTGLKKGKVLTPKGMYWKDTTVIVVGDSITGGATRLELPHYLVRIDVTNPIIQKSKTTATTKPTKHKGVLQKMRVEVGFSRGELSRLTGIHYGQLSQYELEYTHPSLETAMKLAEVLECDPRILMKKKKRKTNGLKKKY